MAYRSKLTVCVLTAAFVLVAASATASATRLEVNGQTFRIVWRLVRFVSAVEYPNFDCPVTLEGTFHSRTISKISGQLIGVVTKAAVGPISACAQPESSFTGMVLLDESQARNTLPWHLRYVAFREALPRITGISISITGLAFLFTFIGMSCLYRSALSHPPFAIAERNVTTGVITNLRAEAANSLPLLEGSPILCPSVAVFRDGEGVRSVVTQQGTTTAIVVTLVR